ncbi:acetyl esterase [Acinetobacter sp. 187]|uniref:acetyl esterase n=1 Tax=Acinetobacter lanii TaxID=2715163 RepID=UPI00140760FE|nr:acetyl esterase [Acinetobacter lanii]NHC02365.1 acetyl esterase [Acinetobacter lanii]
MTSYLLVFNDGSQVEAIKDGGLFTTNNGQTYSLADAVSFINFDHITHDQYEFESLYKRFTLKGDYSKFENLMYRNSVTEAAYKTWRIAKGYKIDDPEYKAIERNDVAITSPIYPTNHGKWMGD